MSTSTHLIDYDEAARLLSVKKATLYAWVCLRRIPHYRISGKMVRFDPDELLAWVHDHRVQPAGELESP